MQQEQINEPMWEVVLEMLKDHMYNYKGQTINEIVMAVDKDNAQEKVLKMHDMTTDMLHDTVKVLGIRTWTE